MEYPKLCSPNNVFLKIQEELPELAKTIKKDDKVIFQQLVDTFKQVLLDKIREKSEFFTFKFPEDIPKCSIRKFAKKLNKYHGSKNYDDHSEKDYLTYGLYGDDSEYGSVDIYIHYPSKKRKRQKACQNADDR